MKRIINNINNMKKIEVGNKLKVINDKKLPGNEYGPAIKNDEEYTCKSIHLDSKGNQHIDIGLKLELNWVTSYETKETLPPSTHWCHPSRFEIIG